MKEKIKVLISAKSTDRMVLMLENYPDRNSEKEGFVSEKRLFWALVSKYLSLFWCGEFIIIIVPDLHITHV
jgi:hypothetical protein